MTSRIASRISQEFRPDQLLPGLLAGFINGIISIIIMVSFAALIFSGDLRDYVSNGIGFALFGALAVGMITALVSSFPGAVAIPQDSPAAISALIATQISVRMLASTPIENIFLTVVAAISISSLLTGVFSMALGTFRLGGFVRYIPYPVIGGFLAGTGWILVRGALGTMTDLPTTLSNLPELFMPHILIKWLPGLIFAVLLLLILRRCNHFLILPSMLILAIGVFYLFAWLTHLSIAEASSMGWLLGPFPQGGLWKPLTLSSWERIEWLAIFGQIGNIGTIMILSVVSLLLNASGIEITAHRDIDLNRELQAMGISNLAAGMGNSQVGYTTLSLSVLGLRMGAKSRLVGIVAAILCGAMLFFGASILSLFPKPVLGGLLLFLGLAFLVEWLYDGWFKLSKADYIIVLLILATMASIGVLQGIGLGLILAVILFVFEYSRINVIKHVLSGRNFHSNVERPRLYQQLLHKNGDRLYILQLQGFIFFGTAQKLLEHVRQRLNARDLPRPGYIVLDFRHVKGADASAALSFSKIKQLAQAYDVILVFTQLSPGVHRQLEKEVFGQEENVSWKVFPDLDHGVEWCEDKIISELESVGLTTRPRTMKQQLEEFLPKSSRMISLMELITEEEKAQESKPEQLNDPRFMKYMERIQVEPGKVLIRQGEPSKGLYFIEEGEVTVTVEEEGKTVRIRKIGAGTVIGEIGLYLGTHATATVLVDQPGTFFLLSKQNLMDMEKDEPEIAAAFHKFIAQLLSERVLSTTNTMQALLE